MDFEFHFVWIIVFTVAACLHGVCGPQRVAGSIPNNVFTDGWWLGVGSAYSVQSHTAKVTAVLWFATARIIKDLKSGALCVRPVQKLLKRID